MTFSALLLAGLLQQAPEPPAVQAAPVEAVQPHIAAGLALYKKRRFRAAQQEFQKAVEADPASAPAHFYLGYTLYKIGEPRRRLTPEKEQAREHFARCFELDPGFRPTWRPPE